MRASHSVERVSHALLSEKLGAGLGISYAATTAHMAFLVPRP